MASPILTTTIENWGSILKRRPETTLPYLRDEDPHIPARTWVKAPRILTQQSMFFWGKAKRRIFHQSTTGRVEIFGAGG